MEGRREELEEISVCEEADILGWTVDSQYNRCGGTDNDDEEYYNEERERMRWRRR